MCVPEILILVLFLMFTYAHHIVVLKDINILKLESYFYDLLL